jgi:DNA repair exonuclease SbcCD ATPase subunit
MSEFTSVIAGYRQQYTQAERIKKELDSMIERLKDMNEQYAVMLEAQQLLATISDSNTNAVLDYVTGVINKALSELFPYDERRIYLDRTLYRGTYAHIKVKLIAGGKERNMELQSGNGLRQIVSFLFVVSLIEIRKGRRILIMDELLNGLHPEAKSIIVDIIQIFAEEGFQFIAVEYGVNNVGKLYIVEKPGDKATVTPLGDIKYNDDVFIFNRPVEEVDKTIMVDETE